MSAQPLVTPRPERVGAARAVAPATRTVAPPTRHLRPVAAPQHERTLVPFISLCIGIIVAALVAVLVLNTQMSAQAYEARDLRLELADLAEQRADLITQIDAQAAPQHLAAAASDLGMRRAGGSRFISLEDEGIASTLKGFE